MQRAMVALVLGSGLVGGCLSVDSTGGYPPTPAMFVSDFRTDFGTDGTLDHGPAASRVEASLAIILHGGGYVDGTAQAARMQDALWLVSVERGERVAGEVMSGVVSMSGSPQTGLSIMGAVTGTAYSFVPTVPLSPGWYVLAFDTTDVASGWSSAGGHLEDRVLYARLHIGPMPTWRWTDVSCDELGCLVSLVLSEEVSDRGTTSVSVTRDGAPVSCVPAEAPSSTVAVSCALPDTERAQIEVTLSSDVIAVPGGTAGVAHQTVTLPYTGRMLVEPRFGVDAALRDR